MDNIDFSLAPEGATHYANDEHGFAWYKGGDGFTCRWVACDDAWVSVFTTRPMIKIPANSKTELRIILPQNDKEQMLCEQVLRMCRGELSEFLNGDEWVTKPASDGFVNINLNGKYRAKQKPKFEVPLCIWEFIPKQFNHIRVSLNGETTYVDGNGKFMCDALLTFDTEGYDLPTVVHRPK